MLHQRATRDEQASPGFDTANDRWQRWRPVLAGALEMAWVDAGERSHPVEVDIGASARMMAATNWRDGTRLASVARETRRDAPREQRAKVGR